MSISPKLRGILGVMAVLSLVVMVAVGSSSPVAAQLPESLSDIVSDESQTVTLAYPPDWVLAPEEGITISQDGLEAGGGAVQIVMRAEVVETGTDSPDTLADWLIAEAIVPNDAPFYPQAYSGYDGWQIQAENLDQAEVYTALTALQLPLGRALLIQSDFPAENLTEDAPKVTRVLNSLLVLLAPVSSAVSNLTVQVPDNWFEREGLDGLLLAPTEANLQHFAQGDLTDLVINLKVHPISTQSSEDSLQSITPDALEALLSNGESIEVQRTAFEANGNEVLVSMRDNQVAGWVEWVFLQSIDAETLLEMRAFGINAEQLNTWLPHLQAIFATIKVNKT